LLSEQIPFSQVVTCHVHVLTFHAFNIHAVKSQSSTYKGNTSTFKAEMTDRSYGYPNCGSRRHSFSGRKTRLLLLPPAVGSVACSSLCSIDSVADGLAIHGNHVCRSCSAASDIPGPLLSPPWIFCGSAPSRQSPNTCRLKGHGHGEPQIETLDTLSGTSPERSDLSQH